MIKITATELPRFLTCNGSLQLAKSPALEKDNTVRDEGNAADWLIGEVFAGRYTPEELVDRKAPNGVYITGDMVEYLEDYFDFILGRGEVEKDTSYAGQNFQVSGRADHVFYDGADLHVSDFKYGWRIVEPDENMTLVSHANGFIAQTGIAPVNVHFKIFQPRPWHHKGYTRTWTISYVDLYNKYILPMWQKLENPDGQLNTSSHCYKCPSRTNCPAALLAEMNAIDASHVAYDIEIDNDNLESLIGELTRAQAVIKETLSAYEDLATQRIRKGDHFKNYVVKADMGREVWKKEVDAEFIEALTGKSELVKKQLITPNQARKLGVSDDILGMFAERPNKGVKLVKEKASDTANKLFNKKEGTHG